MERTQTEISPEAKTTLRKSNRDKVRDCECIYCNQPIGNREFQESGKDLICLDCSYETGDCGG
jgi:hypothetical protein